MGLGITSTTVFQNREKEGKELAEYEGREDLGEMGEGKS